MQIVLHAGVIWVYRISNGWFTHLKAFPQAVKKVGDDYIPDPEHRDVLKYMKDSGL